MNKFDKIINYFNMFNKEEKSLLHDYNKNIFDVLFKRKILGEKIIEFFENNNNNDCIMLPRNILLTYFKILHTYKSKTLVCSVLFRDIKKYFNKPVSYFYDILKSKGDYYNESFITFKYFMNSITKEQSLKFLLYKLIQLSINSSSNTNFNNGFWDFWNLPYNIITVNENLHYSKFNLLEAFDVIFKEIKEIMHEDLSETILRVKSSNMLIQRLIIHGRFCKLRRIELKKIEMKFESTDLEKLEKLKKQELDKLKKQELDKLKKLELEKLEKLELGTNVLKSNKLESIKIV